MCAQIKSGISALIISTGLLKVNVVSGLTLKNPKRNNTNKARTHHHIEKLFGKRCVFLLLCKWSQDLHKSTS